MKREWRVEIKPAEGKERKSKGSIRGKCEGKRNNYDIH